MSFGGVVLREKFSENRRSNDPTPLTLQSQAIIRSKKDSQPDLPILNSFFPPEIPAPEWDGEGNSESQNRLPPKSP